MKNKIQAFLLFCGMVLGAVTLAPTDLLPKPPPGPGPYAFDCPVLMSPFDYSEVKIIKGKYCLISCYYEDGSNANIVKPAPLGVCEATDSGAIYH
jgi:hypothetical protein